jgi:hypothetical protein
VLGGGVKRGEHRVLTVAHALDEDAGGEIGLAGEEVEQAAVGHRGVATDPGHRSSGITVGDEFRKRGCTNPILRTLHGSIL